MTGTSCTDDARVKVPSLQKVTYFLQDEIFHRDVIDLYFVCLKMLLAAVIQDKQASNNLFHLDSSFILCNNMKTSTASS